MKIAYLILAHSKPNQLKRLVKKFKEDTYVHIDKRKNINEFLVKEKNVFFVQKRVKVNWGGYSMVEAALRLIYEAYNKKKYDYYILLSGSDYPILNEEKLKEFLSRNNGCNYIDYSYGEDDSVIRMRYRKYKLFEGDFLLGRCITKIVNLICVERKTYKSIKIYKGSQWWCLSKCGIEYILNYINLNKGIKTYFKYTHIPDEMFFQSIILTGKNLKIRNDNLRYIVMNGSHPEIIRKSDYLYLITSACFFGRKFDEDIDKNILDKLDEFHKRNNDWEWSNDKKADDS